MVKNNEYQQFRRPESTWVYITGDTLNYIRGGKATTLSRLPLNQDNQEKSRHFVFQQSVRSDVIMTNCMASAVSYYISSLANAKSWYF